MPERPATTPARRAAFDPLLNWMADRILEQLLAEDAASQSQPEAARPAEAAAPEPVGLARLQAQKASRQAAEEEQGRLIGEAWALNRADFDALERVAALRDASPSLEALAGAIDPHGPPRAVAEAAGLAKASAGAVAGFITAAAAVFEQV